MKIAYVVLIAAALTFVVRDVIVSSYDWNTYVMGAVCIALVIWVYLLESREQKS